VIKVTEYAALVAARKACHCCAGLKNPADVASRALDSNHIGPWSRWQGNLDASVMVFGQDWGDVVYFKAKRGRSVVRSPTNSVLVKLLAIAGVEVASRGTRKPRHTAFFTNAILCLKSGGVQGKVTPAWFRSCGDFLHRQIEIVQPRVVVGLGELAYRSILAGFSVLASRFRAEVEAPEGRPLPNSTRAFAVYHCGPRILNTHRKLDQQKRDWLRIRPYVQGGQPGG